MTYLFGHGIQPFEHPEQFPGEFHTVRFRDLSPVNSKEKRRAYARQTGVSSRFLKDVLDGHYRPDDVLHLYRCALINIPMEEFLQRPSAEVASKYKVRQWRIQNWKKYKKIRNSRQPPAEASSKVHYVIPSEELDQRDNTFALSAIAQHGTTHTPSLRLLAEVQQEEACPDREAALRARLSPLPLSAVSECIEQFSSAAAAWHQTVLRPLTTEVREQQRQLEREQFHVLLYNVAWWQRTYPFEVVTTVLEFRRLNPSLFPPPGAVLMRLLNDMIEQVSSRLFPSLASLPWLLRCDIFMSYPQDQLKVAEAYTQAYASPEGGTRYTRADPQSVLAPYLPAEDLFPLTCRRLSHEAYRKLRTALERHKKDGVVRLCETTTKGEKK